MQDRHKNINERKWKNMTYKAMADRRPREEDVFTMGETKTIRQKNGVISTITKAVRRDDMADTQVTIFANGSRAARIAPFIRPGMQTRLVGKYSQRTVFVALEVAGTC